MLSSAKKQIGFMAVLQLPWLSLGSPGYIELAGLGSELPPSCQIQAASKSLQDGLFDVGVMGEDSGASS